MVNALLGFGTANYPGVMSRTLTMLRPSEPNRFRRHLRFSVLKRSARRTALITTQDVRDFLLAYCACFLAVSAFIA